MFLAPRAERQRRFSNADLSVVVRRRRQLFTYNFFSQNFFCLFLLWNFPRKVPMYYTKHRISLIVLNVILKGRKCQILLIFYLEAIFSKNVC